MTDVNPKLIDQIRCSRPILFENDSTEFRYSARGTCFLCTLDTALFIVTAKHVLQSFTAEEIRVPFSYSAKEFIPYTGVCSPGREIGDLERADLSIMPVPSAFREHPLFGDQGPLMLADDTIERAQERGADLVLRGFPCHSNGIDYDTKTIARTGEVFGAVVIGPSSFDEDCTELKFNDLSRCDGVDGLRSYDGNWVTTAV